MMLQMNKEEKEVVIYVTTGDSNVICDSLNENSGTSKDGTLSETEDEGNLNYEEGSDYFLSEDSYHSVYSTDDEVAGSDGDGNSWMFPVAFAVMENESEKSWEWF